MKNDTKYIWKNFISFAPYNASEIRKRISASQYTEKYIIAPIAKITVNPKGQNNTENNKIMDTPMRNNINSYYLEASFEARVKNNLQNFTTRV